MAKAPRPLRIWSGPASATLYGRSPIGKGTGLQNPLLKVRLLPAVHTRVSPIGWAPGRLPGEAGSIPASRSSSSFSEIANSSGERRVRRRLDDVAHKDGRRPMEVQRAVTPPLSSTVSSILTPSTCGCRQAGRHQASTLTRAGSIPAIRSLGRSSTVERPPLKRWAEGSSPSAPALGSGATGSAAASEADG